MGDSIRSFIIVYETIFLFQLFSISRILVEVNLRQALFESLELVMGNKTFTLSLDHLNVPFGCYRYHIYGHVILNFSLHHKNKI